MQELSDYVLKVSLCNIPKIQEGHIVLGHIMCGLIENPVLKGAS
jgi:D-sedoheptulose 7-phosphate isomerase